MRLEEFLRKTFEDGIDYEDATQLCQAIYCSSDVLPEGVIDEKLSMQHIAEAFAGMARVGAIKNYSTYKSVMYGANYQSINDKGHWVEVQAAIVKLGTTYDAKRVRELMGAHKQIGSAR